MIHTNNDLTPIQIIGTQRSGSNLLRLILNQSPHISAHHPPHILQVFYPILDKYGDLGQNDNFRRLIHDICRLIETNPVKWDIDLNREEIFNSCKKNTLVEIFKVVYEMMARKDKALFWCCKSMANVNFYKHIESDGLKPYYIHLVRDGRDVASSFKKTLVGEKHAYHLASTWKKNFLKAKEVLQDVERKRCLTIKYETLISEPETVLEQLSTFLNIDLDKSALNYFDSNESRNTAAAGSMWSNLTMPIIANNTGKYIETLSKDEIEIFEQIAGDILEENGYGLYSVPIKKGFSIEDVNKFDELNLRLKKEASLSKHLEKDRECRMQRDALLDELKRLVSI